MRNDFDFANFRARTIQGIIERLNNNNIKVIIHEPTLNTHEFEDVKFTNISDVIIANRLDDNMRIIEDKIYTRDLFTRD